ncbi:hypothetical protein TNCV_414021 [Trichonephila clavipes]|nr:hypothetical protein TNCV_414021 [Trichonephila clavipes]
MWPITTFRKSALNPDAFPERDPKLVFIFRYYEYKQPERQASLDVPPDLTGISSKSPEGTLEFDGGRNDQTAVSRWLSEHLKCMTFESNRKVFQTCPKRYLLPAFPEHMLDCLGFSLKDVYASPLLVLDFATVNGLMDLI